MMQAESLRLEASSSPVAHSKSRFAFIALSVTSLLLFATVLAVSSKNQAFSLNLLIAITGVLGIAMVVHARFLVQLRSQQKKVLYDLQTTTHRRYQTEKQLLANRALAQSASAEAEALRTTTFALTSNWQLDHVFDTLLESLAELVPYESARVLLLEDAGCLLVARERFLHAETAQRMRFPWTIELADFPILNRVAREQSSLVLLDVNAEPEWREPFPSSIGTRSWLGVPLLAGNGTLGLLCAEHSQINAFTSEHLRLARSLAVSVAAAIRNARLYEQAQIYGAELEKRLSDLRVTQRALEQAEEERLISEDKFQSVFRSSPVAFSITTLAEGCFLDVNQAFEQRCGFSRAELIDRTVFELNIWEHPRDRAFMISQLKNGPVRNLMTRLRTKSGELKLTAYSASRIHFDGRACVLAVSGDVPQIELTRMN